MSYGANFTILTGTYSHGCICGLCPRCLVLAVLTESPLWCLMDVCTHQERHKQIGCIHPVLILPVDPRFVWIVSTMSACGLTQDVSELYPRCMWMDPICLWIVSKMYVDCIHYVCGLYPLYMWSDSRRLWIDPRCLWIVSDMSVNWSKVCGLIQYVCGLYPRRLWIDPRCLWIVSNLFVDWSKWSVDWSKIFGDWSNILGD